MEPPPARGSRPGIGAGECPAPSRGRGAALRRRMVGVWEATTDRECKNYTSPGPGAAPRGETSAPDGRRPWFAAVPSGLQAQPRGSFRGFWGVIPTGVAADLLLQEPGVRPPPQPGGPGEGLDPHIREPRRQVSQNEGQPGPILRHEEVRHALRRPARPLPVGP